MVEFAIVLPIICLVLFGIIQFGLVYRNYLTVTDAVRVAARAAAVNRISGACPAARTAMQNAVSANDWTRMSSSFACTAGPNPGDPVTVSAKYPYSINIIGKVVSPANAVLTSSATERLE
jgi:Flp pilus assembly protein TadG